MDIQSELNHDGRELKANNNLRRKDIQKAFGNKRFIGMTGIYSLTL